MKIKSPLPLNVVNIAVAMAVFSCSIFAQDVTVADSSTEDVAFCSRVDGTQQRYVIRLPKNFDNNGPIDLLNALHGHGSDRWQFDRDSRPECRGARDVAAERGMVFVSPDYRAKTSWMGPAAESDLLQILDDLHGRFRVRNVIVSGGSMGATSALAFAALHPDSVDGVVSLNGTANLVEYDGFSDAIAESYGGSRSEKPDVYRDRSAELFSHRLKMPIASTARGKDTVVPPDSTLRLIALLQKQDSPVLSLHRPEGGHETNYEDTVAAFRFVCEQRELKRRTLESAVFKLVPESFTAVCLGDSVTGICYHTGGVQAFPEMFEAGLRLSKPTSKVRVINAGISGMHCSIRNRS